MEHNDSNQTSSLTEKMKKENVVLNGDVHSERNRSESQSRKLILHFDVRNTVLVADSVTNIQVEQALNSYLTGVVWGREDKGEWLWYSEKPSLSSPVPGAITYYKHLEQKLVKVPSDRATLRQATGDFTQVNIGAKFASYFVKHLELLEWHGGEDPDNKLTMNGREGKQYHYILPSFIKLIRYLHKSKREFAIIIRTYGWDAANVLSSTLHSLQGNHPLIEEPLPISVNLHPGKVTRIPGQIRFEQFHSGDGDEISKTVETTERGIYDLLTNGEDVSAYVDDFLHWQDNAYQHTTAKPVWVDPFDKRTHHIFFDDNIRVTDSDSIVDLRIFDQSDRDVARSLSMEEIDTFEDMCLVQADLLESTSNIDYFIEKVNKCEKRYTDYLRNFPQV